MRKNNMRKQNLSDILKIQLSLAAISVLATGFFHWLLGNLESLSIKVSSGTKSL